MSLGSQRGLRSSEGQVLSELRLPPRVAGVCVVSKHPESTALDPLLRENFITIFPWDHVPGLLGRAILTQLGIWDDGTSLRSPRSTVFFYSFFFLSFLKLFSIFVFETERDRA